MIHMFKKMTTINKIIMISGITCLIFAVPLILLNNNSKKHNDNHNSSIIYYEVLFDYSNDDISTIKVENGSSITEPQVPEKEGMVFLGWYLNDKLYDFSSKVTDNIKLVAKWSIIKEDEITVTFNSNGGTSIENIIIKKGEKVSKPNNPILENNKFLGWYFEEKEFDFDSTINENIVLTAKWEKINSSNTTNNQSNSNNNNISNSNIEPQSIYLNLKEINMYCGDTEIIKATVLPDSANNKTISWTSSNPKVATVDNNGKVTMISKGTTIISATTVNGKTDSTTINVIEECNQTTTTKPDKVTGLFVEYKSNGEVALFYDVANNAEIYNFYRSIDNKNYTKLEEEFSSLTAIFNNLDTSKDYYYKVRGCLFNTDICGEFSDPVFVPARISEPSNIRFDGLYSVNANTGGMTITFDENDADQYLLYSSENGVSSNDMDFQDNITSNSKIFWNTEAIQYKIIAKKSGHNYTMYSTSNIYKIPSIGKSGQCHLDITRTAHSEGTTTNYTYNYKYTWDTVKDIEGYYISSDNNNIKMIGANETSYSSYIGSENLEIHTYKNGSNYNIETYNRCTVSKNY